MAPTRTARAKRREAGAYRPSHLGVALSRRRSDLDASRGGLGLSERWRTGSSKSQDRTVVVREPHPSHSNEAERMFFVVHALGPESGDDPFFTKRRSIDSTDNLRMLQDSVGITRVAACGAYSHRRSIVVSHAPSKSAFAPSQSWTRTLQRSQRTSSGSSTDSKTNPTVSRDSGWFASVVQPPVDQRTRR